MYNDISICIYHNTVCIMASSVQRLNIMSLYRAKLRVCIDMGHTYGSWRHIYIYNTNNLERQFNKKKLINQRNPGTIIWNNVRHQYKIHINKTDSEGIDELIDTGFYWLSMINNVYNKYKNTMYQKWGFYPVPLQIHSNKV